MNIIIRGQKVQSQLIAKSLAYVRKDNYNPVFLVSFYHWSSWAVSALFMEISLDTVSEKTHSHHFWL